MYYIYWLDNNGLIYELDGRFVHELDGKSLHELETDFTYDGYYNKIRIINYDFLP